jgi:DNA-binding beta-propeller fold protein YncE
MLSRKVRWFSFLTALLLLIPVFVVEAEAQAKPSEMHEAGLLVGNALPFGATDGILRYDGRGAFIDNMIPVGVAGVAVPCCMTFGPDENLYVSSPLDSKVLRFNGVTGDFIDTFIPAGSGGLVVPLILLFHGGYLYVGDTGAGAIRRYDAKTGAYVDNFIPDNSQGMGTFGDLQHFAFGPDKNLYVAAELSKRVLRYDGQTGAFIDSFVPSNEGFSPSGLTFGSDGLMYVGSYAAGEVRRYDVRTKSYELFIPAGGTLPPFGPVGLVFGPDGNFYVASVGSSEILRYDGGTGRFLGALVPTGRGGITGPRAITWKAKTTVCHRPGGNPAKGRTLTIGYLSARDHLRHGDTLGPCR